jgi:hypothetical protein
LILGDLIDMPMLRYDYDSVLARLKERTLQKLDGQNILLFSTNAAWLEAVAEEFDDLSLYDEFLTRESVWDTAMGSSSIMKQVSFFDYTPHRKIGSTGIIRFSASKTFDGNWPFSISIPRWTQSSGGGITFLTKESADLPNTTYYIDIPVIQGEIAKFTTTITQSTYPQPKGTAYAQIRIFDPDIENVLYEVRVNGELWKEIGNIRLSIQESDPEKAKVYSIRNMPKYEGVILFFGNGMFGKSLQYGDNVEFTYLKTLGAKGNVLSAGVINIVDSEIQDERGNVVTLYCTNPSAMTGGQDYELLEDIKANAPRSFKTGNRAISSQDYETLIKQTGTVDKVQVWGEKEINEDNGDPPGTFVSTAENLIYITGFGIDQETLTGVTLTEANKDIIRKFLNDKKGTTDILQFVDTQFVYVNFNVIVWIDNTLYTVNQIYEHVRNALIVAYSVNSGVYKKSLYHSDYIRTIDEVTGVDHTVCELTFFETLLFSSAYGFNTTLGLEGIKSGTVSIKIKNDLIGMGWKELAHDDGDGNLIGSLIDPDDPSKGSYVIPGAKISYIDGSIGDVIVTFGLTEPYQNYSIKIDFELDSTTEKNLVLTARNQMIVFGSSDIETRFMVDSKGNQ